MAASPSGLVAIPPNVTLLCGSQEYIYTVTVPIFPVQGRHLSKEGTFSLRAGDTNGGGNKQDLLKIIGVSGCLSCLEENV